MAVYGLAELLEEIQNHLLQRASVDASSISAREVDLSLQMLKVKK
jgi:hypothetical protein